MAHNASAGRPAAPTVIIARPQSAALPQTAAKLRRRGFAPFILAAGQIEAAAWQWPQENCAALLAASANAFLALPPVPPEAKSLPVFCVGFKTARAARQNSFGNIAYIGENAEDLCRFLQKSMPLSAAAGGKIWLYLAGAPRRPILEDFLAAAKLPYKLIQTYARKPRNPAADLPFLPQPADYILLYSAQSAADSVILAAAIGTETKILCLSKRIADFLPPNWQKQAVIAGKPTEAALLALLETEAGLAPPKPRGNP